MFLKVKILVPRAIFVKFWCFNVQIQVLDSIFWFLKVEILVLRSIFVKHLVFRSKFVKFWCFNVKILVLDQYLSKFGFSKVKIGGFQIKICQNSGSGINICQNIGF